MSTTDDTNEHAMPEETSYERKGRSCCFCFCDMRRAVIILNMIAILAGIADLTGTYFILDATKDDVAEEASQQMDALDDLWRKLIALISVGFGTSLVAIVGAVMFSRRMVALNAGYVVVSQTLIIYFSLDAANDVDEYSYGAVNMLSPIIKTVMMVFAHLSFVREVSEGIMSKENYHNEEQSCCCV
jgi:hypothetical protein